MSQSGQIKDYKIDTRDKDGQTANASLRVGNSDYLSGQESE
jgi:hypothetical protein